MINSLKHLAIDLFRSSLILRPQHRACWLENEIKHLAKSISKKLSKLKKHEEVFKKNGQQITELFQTYREVKAIELNDMDKTIKQARKRKAEAEPEERPIEPVAKPVAEPVDEPQVVQPSPERRTSKRKKSQHVKESEPSTSSESL